jgi:2-polyprenyl-6-hydroxyphenyl methylase/3-demethylubiquinone-9 3-methyltransferase
MSTLKKSISLKSLPAVGGILTVNSNLFMISIRCEPTGSISVEVEYRKSTAEDFAKTHASAFDVVTCLEMLEHVPEPGSVVQACAQMTKPGGTVFFSTINRNPKSYLLAIIGVEYILRMLPKGTHEFSKFIRPSELGEWIREAGLEITDMTGLLYNPLTKTYKLSEGDVDVNYMISARKPN